MALFEWMIEGLSEVEIAGRIIFSFLSCMIVTHMAGKYIGDEKKEKWFKKRQQSLFFNRRSFIGESMHFGRPKTKEGVIFLGCMLLLWLITAIVIFKVR